MSTAGPLPRCSRRSPQGEGTFNTAGPLPRCSRRSPQGEGTSTPPGSSALQVASLIFVLAPLVFTDTMPASRDAALEYIWLVPMT